MQKQLGKYQLIEQIGAGKFGIVYSAKDIEIGRLVAVKILRPEGFASAKDKSTSIKRFSTEMRAAGRLNHPNICAVFDSGLTAEGLPYLVMQLVEGKPLDLVLRDLGGAMEPERALLILFQLAEALDFAHSKNVIHRDLKPSNIILNEHDRPYILDFSAAFLSDVSMLDLESIAGTPQYMSPEIIQGAAPTAATDLYSLGILAYVLFTGSRPFRDGDIKATLDSILRQSAFSFAELGCPLGAKLERVLRRSLSKNPEDRFQTGKEFVMACSNALSSKGTNTFSQVAVRDQRSIDPSASIFVKHQQKVIKSSDFRKGVLFIFKIFFGISFLAVVLFIFSLSITDKLSVFHQNLASIFKLELKSDEIKELSDKQVSLLLDARYPKTVKRAALHDLERRNLTPFADSLALLLSDSDNQVRYLALNNLIKLSSSNPETVEQNLLFALADQDSLVKIVSFYKLSLNPSTKHHEILVNTIEEETDLSVKEIMQSLLDTNKSEVLKPVVKKKKSNK